MIGVSEENKIDELAAGLYHRLSEQIDEILTNQIKLLGGEPTKTASFKDPLEKTIFPDDDKALAIYKYKGQKILGVRISDNNMGIVFDIPNLETQTQGEVQEQCMKER